MRRLAPGVYDDEAGGLHLELPELLAAAGYADTPENQQAIIAAVAAQFSGVPIVVTPGCDCDQSNNPDVAYHASDCDWRKAQESQAPR